MNSWSISLLFFGLTAIGVHSDSTMLVSSRVLENLQLSTTDGSSSSNKELKSKNGFAEAFVSSLSMVVVSELGDKTFFIAAIMSMKYSRVVVYAGAMSALLLMTIVSAFFGYAVQIIPRIYVVYLSAVLFLAFGLKMLYSAYYMSDNAATEEMEEAQAEIQKREASVSAKSTTVDIERNLTSADEKQPVTAVKTIRLMSFVFFEAFLLTFFAEWGDRSQITTVVLAAKESVYGVIAGGTLGHAMCTGLAVLGGRLVSQRISVKNVTFLGGLVFLVFAISTIIAENYSG